jgi:2-dehydropantoate 2-reductase
MENCKITVAGIGAVGGQIAAMLGRKYEDNITLIARGKHAETLREKGLIFKSEFYGDSIMHPAAVVERGDELPVQDFVFICCKNYSIDQICEQVRPCIGPDTIVMPVMNGVEPGDRIREKFPEAICIKSRFHIIKGESSAKSIIKHGQASVGSIHHADYVYIFRN